MEVQIVQKDGSDLDVATVGFINNPLHSMIKQLSIRLNGTLITEQSDTYAYRAYIESLLNYTIAEKSSFLTSALFYKDTAGNMDEPNPAQATANKVNKGLLARSKWGHHFVISSKQIDSWYQMWK